MLQREVHTSPLGGPAFLAYKMLSNKKDCLLIRCNKISLYLYRRKKQTSELHRCWDAMDPHDLRQRGGDWFCLGNRLLCSVPLITIRLEVHYELSAMRLPQNQCNWGLREISPLLQSSRAGLWARSMRRDSICFGTVGEKETKNAGGRQTLAVLYRSVRIASAKSCLHCDTSSLTSTVRVSWREEVAPRRMEPHVSESASSRSLWWMVSKSLFTSSGSLNSSVRSNAWSSEDDAPLIHHEWMVVISNNTNYKQHFDMRGYVRV